jgi:hypothetical protein
MGHFPLYVHASSPEINTRHFTIDEPSHLRNGVCVDDHKFDFNFGISEFVQSKDTGGVMGKC